MLFLEYNHPMPASLTHAPITKLGGLKELAHILAAEPIIAVDTESNSLFAYREQVCLIQFSTRAADYLVDPLAMADVSALEAIFADPGIIKTFHAAEYDLICMKRDFGFSFNNLFDTMIAARIVGRKEVGLGSLLEEEFGIKVDKRYQRANWGQRPLPDYLLEYAQQDTHHLIPLKERLEEQLEEKGLRALAEEDFRRVAEVEAGPENGKPACWRVNGVHLLSPQQAAVLQELCKYRDEMARSMNRPLFKVMGDETLIALASALPASMEELKALPGMTNHQVGRHGKALLQAVGKGLKATPVHPPRSTRPDERYLARMEALKQWRKEKARELKVESDIILPRDLLHELAARNPRDEKALGECLAGVPWRREQYGGEIVKTLARINVKR
jgi:ribonuclease D